MIHRSVKGRGGRRWARRGVLLCGGLLASLAAGLSATGNGGPDYAAYIAAAGGVRSATTASSTGAATVTAIPAFARKYGLRCSACHTAWPELNVFGQRFKDAGYQLGNDRDSPIWTNPAYWPIAVRTTPQWHFESTTNQLVDDPLGGPPTEKTVTQSGFDISGADLLMMGTLYKNITFGFVPTLENGEGVGIEAAFVRFDNLFKSSWVNVKMGKFELDNLLSEKRIVTLSNNGGFYQSYHFVPVNDATNFGLGDNQIGAEWMGHSKNSYQRISIAVLDGTDGDPGIGAGQSYDGMITASQAFDAGKMGIERIGLYAYVGQRPTVYETSNGGDPVAGSGTDNKSFYRVGVVGDFFLGNNLEFLPFYMYGSDNAYLATGTPGDQPLPAGAQDTKWNGFLLETHYYVNPQLMLINRLDFIRMTQQADPATEKTLGNSDAYTFGVRWYPMMISRAGLSLHWEVAYTRTTGTVPMSGDGVGLPPLTATTEVGSTSALFAFDFAF